jgi:hypothetical protein
MPERGPRGAGRATAGLAEDSPWRAQLEQTSREIDQPRKRSAACERLR